MAGSSLLTFSRDAQAAIPLQLWPKDQNFGCIEPVACVRGVTCAGCTQDDLNTLHRQTDIHPVVRGPWQDPSALWRAQHSQFPVCTSNSRGIKRRKKGNATQLPASRQGLTVASSVVLCGQSTFLRAAGSGLTGGRSFPPEYSSSHPSTGSGSWAMENGRKSTLR